MVKQENGALLTFIFQVHVLNRRESYNILVNRQYICFQTENNNTVQNSTFLECRYKIDTSVC